MSALKFAPMALAALVVIALAVTLAIAVRGLVAVSRLWRTLPVNESPLDDRDLYL